MHNGVNLLVLGDICSTADYRKIFDRHAPEELFHDLLPYIREADLCMANLEAPIVSAPTPIQKCGPVLSVKPADISLLKSAGIGMLALANNHIRDHGNAGVISTLTTCASKGIQTIGAGYNRKQAAEPCYFVLGEMTIGILAFAEREFNNATDQRAGANTFEPIDSIKLIQNTKEKCDFLLVLYHGGIEHYRYPSPDLQKRCRKMAFAGADLVLCQHSHCIGTYEKVDGATIVYGQGNSVFGYKKKNESWNDGLVVQVNLSTYGYQVKYIPITAKSDGVHLAGQDASNAILHRFRNESACLDDTSEVERNWHDFCEKQKAMYLPMLFGRSRLFNRMNRILNNLPMRLFYSPRKIMIVENLIQCDAHREVSLTVLEKECARLKSQRQAENS